MAGRARPTLRCLREDLTLAIPRADTPLEDIGHPLLAKIGDRFADDETPRERIAAIDDQVLFKVKVQRWRGAVWVDAGIPWLVAAGQREEGSPDDFYAALAAHATAARARYNAGHSPALTTTTYIGDLLPGREDELRWRAESATRAERTLRAAVHRLVRESLLDGQEHAVMLDGAALGIQVLADQGHETYVAIRIIGSYRGGSSRRSSVSYPGARPTHGCRTTRCRSGQWPPKNRSDPTSWTQPRPRSSSTSNHDPAILPDPTASNAPRP
ncbi:hypothetical protein [Frankia sp. CiP3]|uniref:hypothetical protein n=1 Tax=Frankia sp. CiP3 TaxID=2880971 RepID=UPI001EF4CB36|nr:hypothetical protein [Frankia sp. CiP3]